MAYQSPRRSGSGIVEHRPLVQTRRAKAKGLGHMVLIGCCVPAPSGFLSGCMVLLASSNHFGREIESISTLTASLRSGRVTFLRCVRGRSLHRDILTNQLTDQFRKPGQIEWSRVNHSDAPRPTEHRAIQIRTKLQTACSD